MVVDTIEELEATLEYIKDRKTLIIPVLSDHQLHVSQNKITCIYVYTEDDVERIIPITHTEQIKGFSEHLQRFLELPGIFIYDKKQWLHLNGNADVYDIKTLWWYTYNEAYDETHYYTAAHQFYWRRHQNMQHVNAIIPIMNHLAMCQKIRHYAWPMCMNAKLTDSYLRFNSIYPYVYSSIERNGLRVNNTFKSPELINNDLVFTNYNYYTSTGRPSNTFRGFNFAAMNKEDGTRDAFCSRFERGALVEMDFDSYHVRLIAKLIGYELPTQSIHDYFGQFYFGTDELTQEQREESKQITFRLLYGGIDKEFLVIPFFQKVHDFVYTLWAKSKQRGYIETPILKRQIYTENITNITANKLFNYFLQAIETEVSTQKLKQIVEYMSDKKSVMILYTYDSVLCDVEYEEAATVLPEIKRILEQGNFTVKSKCGNIYSKIRNITL
tara:strand:+ start:3857 stop:5179 length:1323 start_codon:yes stop_codon:yes gene_type:complete